MACVIQSSIMMLAFNDDDSRREYDANDQEALNIKEYFATFLKPMHHDDEDSTATTRILL